MNENMDKAPPSLCRAAFHLIPRKTALLVIDLQNYNCKPGRGINKAFNEQNIPDGKTYFFDRLRAVVIPNVQKLLHAFRECRKSKQIKNCPPSLYDPIGCNVLYTCIESLTNDGRDCSIDYKLSKLHVPKGSSDAKVLEDIKPEGDEIYIPKTSCSVFCSTNIAYVLRNLGVQHLVVCGALTNQCVESAVRDAADSGFLVTVARDACLALSECEEERGLANICGFARVLCVSEIIAELGIMMKRVISFLQWGFTSARTPAWRSTGWQISISLGVSPCPISR
eukprot:192757_1